MKKCKYATLLEMVIAMSLISILMASLLGFYIHIKDVNRNINNFSQKVFQRRYAQQRLAYVLERSNLDKKIRLRTVDNLYKDNLTAFYTAENSSDQLQGVSLVFSFDNGVDIDPEFSNGVLGRLYIDTEDNLSLAVWPLPHQSEIDRIFPMRKEIILANVENLNFSFYYPPHAKAHEENYPLSDKWYNSQDGWPKEFNRLPALMKLYLQDKTDGTEYIFNFQLPNCKEKLTFL